MNSSVPGGDEAAELTHTERSTPVRRSQRGSHKIAEIYAILDEALVCHVGCVSAGAPRVLPMAHVRIDDFVYLHGAGANKQLDALLESGPVCLTITLLDGLVFGRSPFRHSMNYRSVVLYGAASEVVSSEEKRRVLRALVEHVARGRSEELGAPTEQELLATRIVRVPICEGSAKSRSGPPLAEVGLPFDGCWTGELPLALRASPPRAAPEQPASLLASPAVIERARGLGLGVRTPYERHMDELLVSTDPNRIDFPLVHRFLSEESYWARGVTEPVLRCAIDNSLCFGIYRDDQQLAFARVLSDFSRFAWLLDVFVVAEERARGLGKRLIEHVLNHPELAAVERWLLGTRDAGELYARYGFVATEPGRYMVRAPGIG